MDIDNNSLYEQTSQDHLTQEILRDIEAQPNIFLLNQLKQHIVQTMQSIEKPLKFPKYFPKWYTERIKYLSNYLQSLSQNAKHREITKIIEKASKIIPPQTNLWQTAAILMKNSTIKGLSSSLQLKLLKMLQNDINSNRIQDFLKDRYDQGSIDQKEFKQQLKKEKFKNRSVKIQTLLSQILQTRPQKSHIFDTLNGYREKSLYLKGQILSIIDQKQEVNINGQILEADYFQNNLSLLIVNKNEQKTLTFHFQSDFISKIQVNSKIMCHLQKQLNLLFAKFNQERQKQSVLQNCWIEPNPQSITHNTIIPKGRYKIKIYKNFPSANTIIKFKSYDPKASYNFERKKNHKFDQIIFKDKFELKTKSIGYEQLGKSYNLFKSDLLKLTLKNRQDNQKCISLKKITAEEDINLLQKLEIIRKKKNELIGTLATTHRPYFQKILEKFIATEDIIDQSQFDADLDLIIHLSKQIGCFTNRKQLLVEIITDTNYLLLINKDYIITSVKAIELLTGAEEAVNNLKGADIISLNGSTGSGKSTSINYLMGLPLQKIVNRYGDTIVRLKKIELNSEQEQKSSKIGHSIGLSQTLYAKGYPILTEHFQESQINFKNEILCDNPGFYDTRGTAFQICTNLSMDRAIEVCNSIRALVLVVPYQTLTLDRGNHLIQLINTFTQRFPGLIDPNSTTYKHFYILISKCQDTIKIQALRERFTALLNEFQDFIGTHNEGKMENHYFVRRCQITNSLLMMCQEQKVDFVKIGDQIKRDQILKKYIQKAKGGIKKQQYRKAMQSFGMVKKFTDEISASAHTWFNFILLPYLQNIPTNIQENEQQKSKIQNQLQKNTTNMHELEDSIHKNKLKLQQKISRELIECRQELQRVQRQQFHPNELAQFQAQFQQSLIFSPGYRQRMVQLDEVYSALQVLITMKEQQIQAIRKNHQDTVRQIQNEFKTAQSLQNSVQSLAKQQQNELLIKRCFKLNQQLDYAQGQMTLQQYLANFIKDKLSFSEKNLKKTLTVGQQVSQFCTVLSLERNRNFKFVYPPEFDPNQLIKKEKLHIGTYTAIIQARNIKLQGIKVVKNGKAVNLCIIEQFIKTQNEKELPFLRIVVKIPGAEYNRDQIANLQACKRISLEEGAKKQQQLFRIESCIEQKSNQLQQAKIIRSLAHQQIMLLQQENQVYKQSILNEFKKEDKINKIRALIQSKRLAVKSKQYEIKNLEKTIEAEKNTLIVKRQTQVRLIQETKQITEKIQKQKTKYRRMAFLIKDQLNKKIPQSLEKFISLILDHKKQKLSENTQQMQQVPTDKHFNEKMVNFQQFNNRFGKVKDTLLAKVEEHLSYK